MMASLCSHFLSIFSHFLFLSKILPQVSKIFTGIYLPYPWHFATLSHHLIRYNNIYSDILLYTTIYQHIFDTPPNTTIHQHIIYHDMPPPLHSRLGAQLKLPAAVGQRPFRAKVYSYLCLLGGFKQTNRKRNVKISLWCGWVFCARVYFYLWQSIQRGF